MMSRQHLEGIEPLLKLLVEDNVHTTLVILIADIESTNTALVDTYAKGDSKRYSELCVRSAVNVQRSHEKAMSEKGIELVCSTFMTFFEDSTGDVFLEVREKFCKYLHQKFDTINSFEFRVISQVASKLRNGYYQLEYRESTVPDIPVLVQRELTTMAEYLTLGQLVRKYAIVHRVQPFFVVHRGNNTGLLNDTGKFNPKFENSAAIPLIKRTKQVY